MTRSHVQPALLRSRRPDVPTLLHCGLAKSSRDRDAGQARQPCDLAGRLVPAKPHPPDLSCHRRRAHRFVDLLVKKSAGNAEWPGQFLPVQFLNRHQPRKRISFGAAAMRRVVGACHALFHMARRPSAGLSQGAQRRMGPQTIFLAGCVRAMRASSRPCALIAPLGLGGRASLSAARGISQGSAPRNLVPAPQAAQRGACKSAQHALMDGVVPRVVALFADARIETSNGPWENTVDIRDRAGSTRNRNSDPVPWSTGHGVHFRSFTSGTLRGCASGGSFAPNITAERRIIFGPAPARDPVGGNRARQSRRHVVDMRRIHNMLISNRTKPQLTMEGTTP